MNPLNEASLDWKGVRFLDPMGRVFEYEGEFYRAIYPHKTTYARGLFQKGIIDRLVEKGLLVETRITDLKLEKYGLVLWHRRIPFRTTPEEWPREFLRDAALCGIDLNLELLPFGLGTIDFHCDNIQQQKGCSPVWIDLGSICPLESIDDGKGAFQELLKYYLHPLYLLSKKKNLGRTCRLLLADGGIDAGEFHDLTNFSLSFQGRGRKDVLEKIRKWISGLTFPSTPTHWTVYQSEASILDLDPEKLGPRAKMVHDVIHAVRPTKMIDLSCNAGQYSIMAARTEADVFSADLDEGALGKLYELAKNKVGAISVTVALRNLAYGQKHIVRGDFALAIALSHHLFLSQRFPFSHIAEVFASYSTWALLTEFMPNGLGGTRPVPDPLPAGYTLENFRKAFEPYFRRVETIYYPTPEDHSYRVFLLCVERRPLHAGVGAPAEKGAFIWNPGDNESSVTVVCPHCGERFAIEKNLHSPCPHCHMDGGFKEFRIGERRLAPGDLHAPARTTVSRPENGARGASGGRGRLREILSQKIRLSDVLGESRGESRPTDKPRGGFEAGHQIKIAHLCMQDFGGAGNAAYRLHKGLRVIGARSNMIVLNKMTGDPTVKVLPDKYEKDVVGCLDVPRYNSPVWNKQNGRWIKLMSQHPARPAGLEMFTDAISDVRLGRVREVRDADIINLHWVAGTVDWPDAPSGVGDKPVVWTLHDMNAFTGGCHYAGECEKYKERCGACPQLGSTVENDLSRREWERKREAYGKLNIHVVSPSRWLGRCASESALLSRFPVHVIPYGFPLDSFRPREKAVVRKALKIPDNVKIILFGAQSVLNERKGFKYLLEALNKIPLKTEGDVAILTFGHFPKDIEIPSKYSMINLGPIAGEEQLSMVYSAADVYVIPTLEDNLPNTVVEAMACGAPVVGFDIGGMPDMIRHKKTGYLAGPRDIQGLIDGIDWVLSSAAAGEDFRTACRIRAEKEYDLEMQANAYGALYERIWSKTSGRSGFVARDRFPKAGESARGEEKEEPRPAFEDEMAEKIYQGVQVLIENNRNKEAAAALEKLAASCPGHGLVHNDLGVLYHNEGDKEKALRHYELAAELEPESITFQKNLADFYMLEENRLEEALRIYARILEKRPRDVGILKAIGQICLTLEKYDEAKYFYNLILELEPFNADALDVLEKLKEEGDGEAAGGSGDDDGDDDGDDAGAKRRHREILGIINRGDQAEGLRALAELLEEFPDYASGHNDLGVLHFNAGDKEKALHHYERAAALAPGNNTFRKNLADFYLVEQHRLENALAIYVDIFSQDPKDIETLKAIGQICIAMEKYDDAKRFYDLILSIEPWNGDALDVLAKLKEESSGSASGDLTGEAGAGEAGVGDALDVLDKLKEEGPGGASGD
ncbi:MAG: tetratricopeptide repeat protein, partial [Desulfobacterales bacterium]|nr:tetratricopeptide repeat protein [Desulfobacterales bacterium]